MQARLGFLGFILLTLGQVVACGDDAAPPPACDDDTRIACLCEDSGLRGYIACDDGVLGACECQQPDGGSGCTADAQCDDGAFCNGRELCAPGAEDADERGCVHGMHVPFCADDIDCTIDTCSDALNRCVFEAPDEDGDGHADADCEDGDGNLLGDDCDDGDAERYPGNFEVCDEDDKDEDCDPDTFGTRDADGDGAIDAKCCNGDNCGDDCDDSSLARRPLQVEFCDEVDNDCDDEVDEEAVEVPWYSDSDGDGFGHGDDRIMSCVPIPGRSLLDTDCADSNASRHPGQIEVCDFVDNNCDGAADEGPMCGMPQGFPVGDTGGAVGAGDGDGTVGDGDGDGDGTVGDGDGDGTVGDGDGDTGALVMMACDDRSTGGAMPIAGTIGEDMTWSGKVLLSGTVRISGGAHITIMPGTLVLAEANAVLEIGYSGASLGRLTAMGSESQPIKFCGTSGITGYWRGVRFGPGADPASKFSWVLVADAGELAGGGLRVEAPVPMTDIHVRNAEGAGVLASNFGPGSRRLWVSESAVPAALTDEAAVQRLPIDSTWSGNDADVIEVRDGAWIVATAVPNPGVPYFLTGDLDLRGDFTYEIEAGTVFHVEADALIEVGWNNNTSTIEALGTEANPIVFQSASPGDTWGGLIIQNSVTTNSELAHVEVRDAGAASAAALDVRSPITLTNVTLDGNVGTALAVDADGLASDSAGLTIANTAGVAVRIPANAMTKLGASVMFMNNDEDRIEVAQNSHITETGTIRDFGVPYYLPFGTTTRSGSDLTLEAGVELVFGNNAELLVGWNSNAVSITAVGTSSAPIVFRHESGTTDGWYGVRMGRGVNSASRFEYVEFRDGGYDGAAPLVLDMDNPMPAANLANCTFANSSSFGLLCTRPNPNDYSGQGNAFESIGGGNISCAP